MAKGIDRLFEPVRVGTQELPNRVVMAPMTRMFAQDGILAPTAVDYYRRRAAGGVGLILTEGIATSRIAAHTASVPHMLSDEAREMWRQVVRAVHEAGGKILAQLWHTGLGREREIGFDPELPSIGPCAEFLLPDSPLIPVGGNRPPGAAMTIDDIQATIREYVEAAATAQELGFDGVQLHGAHGYLLDQFLWSETNRRTDEYGGDQTQRTRFPREVIEGVRKRTGKDFLLSYRFSQWKLPEHYQVNACTTPEQLEQMLVPLAKAGVDFFDASTRRYWEPAFEGSSLNLAGWARKLTGVPAMTVGSIGLSAPLDITMRNSLAENVTDLSPLIDMIDRNEVDLVGVGRALIANPDWPLRLQAGGKDMQPFAAGLLAEHV